jgi:hypothetical protein
MSNDNEQPIPDGWPEGYRSVVIGNRHDVGWHRFSWSHPTYRTPDCGGWWTEEDVRLAAHRHYRTTREYRLEQENTVLRAAVIAAASDEYDSVATDTKWEAAVELCRKGEQL